MFVRKQRLGSRPRSVSSAAGAARAAAAFAAAALVATAGGCSPRSLVEVDVLGDGPFPVGTLRLGAAGTSKDFPGATLTATTPFKAGIYLPDSVSGSVDVVGNLLVGGNCIGTGQVAAAGVAPGMAAGPVTLTVAHSSACSSGPSGTGGRNGGGSGGATGGGTGGVGGGGNGTGVGGNGVGGGNGTGTGGQTGVNLINNGDFSGGETSWGLPAMVGAVSHAITNGAFCVTLGGGATATIGYPTGGTPPFQINGGASYQFSYQASITSGGTVFEAKVGETVLPYDATGSDWTNEPVGASVQTFTHTFMRSSTSSMMGVAFNLTGGPATVCVDNVSLTQN